eukprot:7855886-Alexandrium_andersonii.AAC.1
MGGARVARPCWFHLRGASIDSTPRRTAILPRRAWSTGMVAICAWHPPTFRPALVPRPLAFRSTSPT